MAIIDKTYFIGDINLPTDNTNLVNRLNVYIEQAQIKYLQKALGYELYSLFIAQLPTPTDARFTEILTGKEYTSLLTGRLTKWTGLKNDEKESFLAYFAAYLYSYHSQDNETGNGQAQQKFENSERVSPADFQVNAYNKGVKHYYELYDFLYSNSETYPEWDFTHIKKINWAGI